MGKKIILKFLGQKGLEMGPKWSFFLNFKKNEHCLEVFEQKRGQNATNMRLFKFYQKEMNGIFYFSWHEVTVAQILKSYWNCFWEGNFFWSFWPKVEFSSIKKFGMWNFSYLLHEVTVVKSFKIDLNIFFFGKQLLVSGFWAKRVENGTYMRFFKFYWSKRNWQNFPIFFMDLLKYEEMINWWKWYLGKKLVLNILGQRGLG